MKPILRDLFLGILMLAACAPVVTVTPMLPTQEPTATPSSIPTSRNTSIPAATPIVSITPLSTISTFTPTFDELVQLNPFPTETPNPTAQAIAQRWNLDTALLSLDGNWAAASEQGILHIIQTQGNNELSVKCETFTVCEFVVPIQWSPDSRMLYFASLLTGESNIPFRQYTGIARINVNTGKVEKMVEDSSTEREYSMSLSPDGNFLAFTDTEEQRPHLSIIETNTLEKILVRRIDNGADAGNILWTKEAEKIVFVSLINCESFIYSFDLKTKMLSGLIENDPTCVELLFMNEHNQVALSKTTYFPFSKSYWYFDLDLKEIISASPTQ